jgi:hypothetical protein
VRTTFLILRRFAPRSLEGSTTVPRASRLALGEHLSMRSVGLVENGVAR